MGTPSKEVQQWEFDYSNEEDDFLEFTDADLPVITYSFTEDVSNGCWFINLIWPTEKKPLSWRGKFCFYVNIYLKIENSYKQILTMISSQFSIFSKPDVFLSK